MRKPPLLQEAERTGNGSELSGERECGGRCGRHPHRNPLGSCQVCMGAPGKGRKRLVEQNGAISPGAGRLGRQRDAHDARGAARSNPVALRWNSARGADGPSALRASPGGGAPSARSLRGERVGCGAEHARGTSGPLHRLGAATGEL